MEREGLYTVGPLKYSFEYPCACKLSITKNVVINKDMLLSQCLRILCLKPEVPELLNLRQLGFAFMLEWCIWIIIHSLGASSPSMLHYDRSDCPADLVVLICKFLRKHIDIPQALSFVQFGKVWNPRARKNKGLRAAAKPGHLMDTVWYRHHSGATSSKEKPDEERCADAAEKEDGFVGEVRC